MNNKPLEEMKSKELLELATEMKIVGRHKMNKETLIKEISAKRLSFFSEPEVEEEVVEEIVFTENNLFVEPEEAVVSVPRVEIVSEFENSLDLSSFEDRLTETESDIKKITEPTRRSSGGRKSVEILEEGEVIQTFDKTYEASQWLADHFDVKYSTVDRYLVGRLKGREVKVPTALIGTEIENYEFRR